MLSLTAGQLAAARIFIDEGQILGKEVYTAELAAGDDWWTTVSKALAELPNTFRNRPCTLILPHHFPLVKWVTIPPVEPFLERATLADAIELELPIKRDDYAWDYIGAGGGGYYIFAEKRTQLAPIFDLCAAADFYPDNAILPPMADFSRALRLARERDANLLHLCIDGTSTTLILTGGKRPYLRYLNFGWDRLFADLEEGGGEPWQAALKNWLAGRPCGEWQDAAERRGQEFFSALSQEILRTEMHQIHHLAGKHFLEILFHGSGDCSTLERLLEGKCRVPVRSFLPEEHCKFSRSLRARARQIGALSWMRLLEAGIFHGSSPPPFLPHFIQRRRFISQVHGLVVAATALLWGALTIGIAYHNAEHNLLERQRLELVKIRAQACLLSKRNTLAMAGTERLVQNFSRIEEVRRRQENWLRLFADLSKTLASVEDAWLDDFSPEMPRVPQLQIGRIAIAGRLLLGSKNEDDVAKERLARLLAGLQKLAWVAAIEDVAILPREGFLQAFRCVLVLRNVPL
jgi:hypothetical protein